MSSMKELEELYNQLKNHGCDNVCLNENNITIYFDERHCMILYPNYYYCSWGMDYVVRARSPNIVYTLDENNTLTVRTPFYEVSINLKEIKDELL